jgi:hypothetical protein
MSNHVGLRSRNLARRRTSVRALVAVAMAALAVSGLLAGPTGTAGASTRVVHGRTALAVNPHTHLRPGITPMVPTGPRSASAPGGAHLSYYGGPVLASLKSVDVLYGSGSYAPYISTAIAPFTSQLLGSGVLDWLSEYNTPAVGGTNQTIGRGTFAGTYPITPAPAHTGAVIADASVQAELVAQITANALPAPDANTSYAVFFPHGEQICMGGTCSGVSGGFCAYHGTFVLNGVTATYQVMPDFQPGSGLETGCGSAPSPVDNVTSVLSHELVETITDPNVGIATVIGPPLGWYDNTNGEIGDICNAQQGTFNGTDAVAHAVQKQFSNAQADCIVSPLSAPSIISPASTILTRGSPGSFTVTTAGFPVPTVTGSGSLPSGMTLTGRVLSGTPTQAGAFPITLTAHNTSGADATQAFTLAVGQSTPATIGITNIPTSSYLGGSFTPAVSTNSDGTTSVTSSTTGVCRVSAGVVSYLGTGSCMLTAHVAASVNFAAADGVAQAFTVLGFTITTTTLPTATRGVAFGPVTLQVAGTGTSAIPNVTTVKWGKISMAKGLKLSSAGILSGIPSMKLTIVGSSITVRATETVTTLNGNAKVKTVTMVQATIPLSVS